MKLPHEILPGPSYDVEKHLAHVQMLFDAYPYNNSEACIAKVRELTKNIPLPLRAAAENFAADLLEDNEIFVTEKPTLLYEPYLSRMQRRFTFNVESAFRAVADFLAQLYSAVPQGRATFTVPLADYFEGKDLIAHAFQFFDAKSGDEYLFPDIRRKLYDNLVRASGFEPSDYDGKRKLTYPRDSNLPKPQLLAAYLQATPFLELFDTRVPFEIPLKTYASHGIILAPPNHGKTQLLGTFVSHFLKEGVGCAVLDPHGDLFNTLKTRVPPERLVVLDPDTNPPGLNFLDFGTSTEAETLQTFSYLMSSLSGGLTDKQGAIVPYLLKLLRQIPDASLETLRLVVDEKVKRPELSQFVQFINALPPVDQGFFHNQFYTHAMQMTKDAIGWKLYSALSSDAFRQMFSAKTNSFSADDAMRDRKVVLVKGSRSALGEHGMQVFLQFIVAQFFSAALRREHIKPDQRHLCVLAVDEAHHVFNSQTANILTECRKYGLGFLAATQVVQQIPEDVKAAIYGATAIKIAGPVSHSDAMILAREMYTTGDFIRSMASVERSHADFAVHVAGVTNKRAVRITVPYGQLEAMPQQSVVPTAPAPPPPLALKPVEQLPATPDDPSRAVDK